MTPAEAKLYWRRWVEEPLVLTLAVVRDPEGSKAMLLYDPNEETFEDAKWTPKSQIKQLEQVGRDGRFSTYQFEVTLWMARQQGWL